jgi:FMN phosphatase YigB (HAD superfamily)
MIARERLYVGDRAEVDGPAAVAAGMTGVIVTRRPVSRSPRPWMHVASYPQLHELVLGPGDSQLPVAAQPTLHRR